MSSAQVDLYRMVDRLDPDQVHALRAVVQQLLRPGMGARLRRDPGPGARSCRWPTSRCGTSPSSACFNGAPDPSERSEEILGEEFARRADADR
jgi:hypothetical protein